MSGLEDSVEQLVGLLRASQPTAAFAPGSSHALVVEVVEGCGARAIDELVEWWTLQDGLADEHHQLFPFGFAPESLEQTLASWRRFLEVIAAIEADESDQLEEELFRDLEYWPQPGWFPLSMRSDGKFIVDTLHAEQPGRVIRCWADQLVVCAPSLGAFVAEIHDVMRNGRPGA